MNSVMEAFNSSMAQRIRQSILKGDFSFCKKEICPYIQSHCLPTRQDILRKTEVIWNGTNVAAKKYKEILKTRKVTDIEPTFFQLSYDRSCSLTCPSCRTDKILITNGEIYNKLLAVQTQILHHIFSKPHNKYTHLSVSGSGDPCASKLYRDLLFNIDGEKFPNVRINLQTNGVMFTPNFWQRLAKLHNNIDTVLISYDAATKETYENIRRGGDWSIINSNLTFLLKLRSRKLINKVILCFVVQKGNYLEMPDLVRMGKKLGVDGVSFQRVEAWEKSELVKTGEYEHHAIWEKTHPEYHQFAKVLTDPIFDDPIVQLGNLTSHRTRNTEQNLKQSISFISKLLRRAETRVQK